MGRVAYLILHGCRVQDSLMAHSSFPFSTSTATWKKKKNLISKIDNEENEQIRCAAAGIELEGTENWRCLLPPSPPAGAVRTGLSFAATPPAVLSSFCKEKMNLPAAAFRGDFPSSSLSGGSFLHPPHVHLVRLLGAADLVARSRWRTLSGTLTRPLPRFSSIFLHSSRFLSALTRLKRSGQLFTGGGDFCVKPWRKTILRAKITRYPRRPLPNSEIYAHSNRRKELKSVRFFSFSSHAARMAIDFLG